MRINPISGNFRGSMPAVDKFAGPHVADIWNPNPKLAKDYTKEIQIALTNIIYGCRKGIGEHTPEGYGAVAKLFNIKNFITLGGESAVFSLNDGNILKISIDKYSKTLPEFHAPEIARGAIQTPVMYKIVNFLKEMHTNMFYFLVQPKGELHVSEFDKQELINKVQKAGYDLCDLKYDQFAYFNINGEKEARFIDMGCIVPKGHGW